MASAALWTSHDVGGSRRGRVGGRADSRGGDGSTKRGHCRTLGSQARRTDGAGKHRVGPRSQHLYKPKKSPDVTDSSVSHHITPPWSRPTCVSLARTALLSATDNFYFGHQRSLRVSLLFNRSHPPHLTQSAQTSGLVPRMD
jgi:hypothetical protein